MGDWLLDIFNHFTPSHVIPTSSELDQHPCLKDPSIVRKNTGTKGYFSILIPRVVPGKDWTHKRIMNAFDAGKLLTTMPICRIKGIIVVDIEEVLENCKTVSEI